MLESPTVRALSILLLLGGLVGLFVVHGTLEPAPDQHAYPGTDDLVADPDVHVGEQVEVGGTVVETAPVVLQLENGDEYVVDGAPPAEVGQQLSVFATVSADGRLEAHDGVAREPWETTYMYAVSIVAALWVLARGLRHWRVDGRDLVVVPRSPDRRPPEESSSPTPGETDG